MKVFISYNEADKQWAEWIAWILEEEGYSAVIQAWDFRPGGNFVLDMQRAAEDTEKTIAVLSANYLKSEYTQPEWAAAFTADPRGEKRKLIPVRVRPCQPDGLLKAIVYVDLVDTSESEAHAKLCRAISEQRSKPERRPSYPGNRQRVEFPGQTLRPLNRKSPGVVRPLLPYKVDRKQQYTDLRQTILKSDPGKPLICLVYGEKKQGQDKFLELAREECYPKAFQFQGDEGLLAIDPALPPEGFESYLEFSEIYTANIADMVPPGYSSLDPAEVNERLNEIFRADKKAIVIESAIELGHWEYHDLKILKYCLQYWNEWASKFPLEGKLLICLFTEFVELQPRSLLKKLINRYCNRMNLCLSEELNFPEYENITFKALPKLDSIKWLDVEKWIRKIVKQELDSQTSQEITTASENMFDQGHRNKVISMEEFAKKMNEILLK